MGYIYKIINNVNEKIYVGKTTKLIESRFKEHLLEAVKWENNEYRNYESKLYPAMIKYGKENFSITIIEECDNDIINDREKYWINKLDSQNNGYNIAPGGLGGPLFKGHKHSEKTKKLLSENNYWKPHKQPQEYIDKRFYKQRAKRKRIQCINTGIIYKDYVEVNKEFNGSCAHALKNKGKFRGLFFIELDDEHKSGYTEQERTMLLLEYEERLYSIYSNGAKKGNVNKSEKTKLKAKEKLLATLANKTAEEKALVNEKRSKALKENWSKKTASELQDISTKRKEAALKYYEQASEEERKLRNLNNSIGQQGKKRYENILSGKHKMFYPDSVPDGWNLITYGFFINEKTGKKTRLRTDIEIPEGYKKI